MNPALAIDGYKADHRRQYPKKTRRVVSNLTPRTTRRKNKKKVIYLGGQYFIKHYLIKEWNEKFFSKPLNEVVTEFREIINAYLGPDNKVGYHHIEELHKLGYLPIEIRSLPEGTLYSLRIPSLVIWNTNDDFFWLTNYLETIMSTCILGPCTSATTAFYYKKLLTEYALKTVMVPLAFSSTCVVPELSTGSESSRSIVCVVYASDPCGAFC
jgi:nicotinamide phosphoribosyltransferase